MHKTHNERLQIALPAARCSHDASSAARHVIILLAGSKGEDHLIHYRAKHFVSEGFIVLGLPYYLQPDENGKQKFALLPKRPINIPLELIQMAVDWLYNNNFITCYANGVYGSSKGAELALAAASKIPAFDAITAIAPTDVVWEGLGIPAQDEVRSSFSW